MRKAITDRRKRGRKRSGEATKEVPTVLDRAWKRFDAILEQMDRVPDVQQQVSPLDWDQHGLPK
jgi:hypothetical protein